MFVHKMGIHIFVYIVVCDDFKTILTRTRIVAPARQLWMHIEPSEKGQHSFIYLNICQFFHELANQYRNGPLLASTSKSFLRTSLSSLGLSVYCSGSQLS